MNDDVKAIYLFLCEPPASSESYHRIKIKVVRDVIYRMHSAKKVLYSSMNDYLGRP